MPDVSWLYQHAHTFLRLHQHPKSRLTQISLFTHQTTIHTPFTLKSTICLTIHTQIYLIWIQLGGQSVHLILIRCKLVGHEQDQEQWSQDWISIVVSVWMLHSRPAVWTCLLCNSHVCLPLCVVSGLLHSKNNMWKWSRSIPNTPKGAGIKRMQSTLLL